MSYSETYLMSRTPREISEMAGLKTGPVETGHKQFDKCVNGDQGYLGTGNVISANQRSGYIRAYTQTLCNGRQNPQGHLQEFDLKPFKLPALVEGVVLKEAQDKEVILYQIRSARGRDETTHGFIVTDTFHRSIFSFTCLHPKADAVMSAAAEHLSWCDEDQSDPVPAEEIRKATSHFDTDRFHELAAHLGYGSATNRSDCKESGLHFHEEKRYSTWDECDPSATMSRAETPALAAALLAIRCKMSPEALIEWDSRSEPEISIDF